MNICSIQYLVEARSPSIELAELMHHVPRQTHVTNDMSNIETCGVRCRQELSQSRTGMESCLKERRIGSRVSPPINKSASVY